MVVTGGKEAGVIKGEGDEIDGDGRLDFEWWAHNAMYS